MTTEANALSATIHARLPVVVESRDWAAWLDPGEEAAEAAAALLRTPGDAVLAFVPVSDAVGKVDADTPEVQVPTGPALMLGEARSIAPGPEPDGQASLF